MSKRDKGSKTLCSLSLHTLSTIHKNYEALKISPDILLIQQRNPRIGIKERFRKIGHFPSAAIFSWYPLHVA